MGARYGAAIAGVVALLALVVLVATWPSAGHPDDLRTDAGNALAPTLEPRAPEEPGPITLPPPTLVAPPTALVPPSVPPSAPSAAPSASGFLAPSTTPSEGPTLTPDETYDAADMLVSAIEARRAEITAQLADATRRGDARMIGRLTQQRDALTASLAHSQSLLAELSAQRAASASPPVAPHEEPLLPEIPPGP